MNPVLTENEARVLRCLMEKSVFTPDQYPLTLNALTHACNQKSSRDPVMALEQGEVQRVVRDLESKHLLRIDENFKSRVEKYNQRFCNTPFSDYQFDAAQFAIVCLLLLRGPQTPGELRARSGRLHSFPDNAAVVEAIEREGEPLLAMLPRTPGRKDAEYMHLFCGPMDVDELERRVSEARNNTSNTESRRSGGSELAQRVERLELEVSELKALVESLR